MRVSRKTLILLLLAVVLVTFAVIAPAAPAKTLAPNAFGAKAYTYVDQLTRITNPDGSYTGLDRQAGMPSEVVAADEGRRAGSATPATCPRCSRSVTSVATSPTTPRTSSPSGSPTSSARAQPRPLVIVGAHYDAVDAPATAPTTTPRASP